MSYNNQGFTLLEVVIVIAVISGLLFSLNVVYSGASRNLSYNQNQVKLNGEQRLITRNIGKYVRGAGAILVSDIDGDGNNDLLINMGEYGGEFDDTDENTDYYICFRVINERLVLYRPTVSFATSGISYPDWPGSDVWDNAHFITDSVVDNYDFNFDETNEIFTYNFTLSSGGRTLNMNNKLHPRILKN